MFSSWIDNEKRRNKIKSIAEDMFGKDNVILWHYRSWDAYKDITKSYIQRNLLNHKFLSWTEISNDDKEWFYKAIKKFEINRLIWNMDNIMKSLDNVIGMDQIQNFHNIIWWEYFWQCISWFNNVFHTYFFIKYADQLPNFIEFYKDIEISLSPPNDENDLNLITYWN
jgi:hypothetical protein